MTQILIIDDDRAIQILLARALNKCGYETAVAEDGVEGLALAQAMQPDLIICDWLMPGLTGLEVCRQVKQAPELATTFFILLTSRVSIEDRVEGLDAGADDFICKPIDLQELQARVRAGLRLHQLSEDLQQQKQLLESELAEAADYVASILPESLNHDLVKIDVRFIPCRQLGGDSFDYFWLDEHNLVIYLLDVSGHGLRSALPSISVINLLRSRRLNQVNYYQPREVLAELNNIFQMSERNDKYFTIWYGVYNTETRELIYGSAGHPPAILLSKNDSTDVREERLTAQGLPIGMFRDVIYENNASQISPRQSLYVFSDGIYELEQENGTIFGLDNLIEILKQHKAQGKEELDLIVDQVKLYNNSPFFTDDLSIVQVKFD